MKYSVSKLQDSFCPNCNRNVSLLSDGNGPSFFICFDCQYVGHVGVGQVSESPEHLDHEDDEMGLPEFKSIWAL